jgi:hypothetical protein
MVPKRSPLFDSHRETESLRPDIAKVSATTTCLYCKAPGWRAKGSAMQTCSGTCFVPHVQAESKVTSLPFNFIVL